MALRLGLLLRLDRQRLGRALAHAETFRFERAEQAGWCLRRADARAKVHHRLREVAGTRVGGDPVGGGADRDAGAGQRRADCEQPRDDALDIGIDHHRALAEGDRRHRRGGIGAESRQRAQHRLVLREDAAVIGDHRLRRGDQIARAGIITEPRPGGHHLGILRGGEAREIGPARHPRRESRPHRGDRRLLQHHLRQPDAIGIGRFAGQRAPWQHTAMAIVPGEQRRGNRRGVGIRASSVHDLAMAWDRR